MEPGRPALEQAPPIVSQLFVNLAGLRIERVETVVGRENFALLGFLYAIGFEPGERLAFVKRL